MIDSVVSSNRTCYLSVCSRRPNHWRAVNQPIHSRRRRRKKKRRRGRPLVALSPRRNNDSLGLMLLCPTESSHAPHSSRGWWNERTKQDRKNSVRMVMTAGGIFLLDNGRGSKERTRTDRLLVCRKKGQRQGDGDDIRNDPTDWSMKGRKQAVKQQQQQQQRHTHIADTTYVHTNVQ